MADFSGMAVMLTGAAGGFGARAARRLAEAGASLALSDITPAVLELGETLRGGGTAVEAAIVDVSDEAAVAAHVGAVLERFGGLDIAINNAGVGHAMAPLHKLAVAEFDRMMAVNARSVFLCMKHQLPPMLAAERGTILNVASAAGLVGAGQLSAYAASKHAVVGLTRAAADEAARRGVRVNALCPSFAVTPLFDEMADEVASRRETSRQEAYTRIVSRVPMARVAEPDEIVEAMVWLVSPQNTFMTGQAISIDGGLTAV